MPSCSRRSFLRTRLRTTSLGHDAKSCLPFEMPSGALLHRHQPSLKKARYCFMIMTYITRAESLYEPLRGEIFCHWTRQGCESVYRPTYGNAKKTYGSSFTSTLQFFKCTAQPLPSNQSLNKSLKPLIQAIQTNPLIVTTIP